MKKIRVKIKTWDELVKEYGTTPITDCNMSTSLYIPCPGDYTDMMEKELPENRIIILEVQNLGNGDKFEWYTESDISPWVITPEMIETFLGDVISVKVEIIESERGWGSKVDEVKEFDDMEQAEEFIKTFNSANDKDQVPDWYMYARLQ